MTRGTWRHLSTLDIDLLVLKVSYSGPTYIKARVIYLDRHCGAELWPTTTTVTIQRKDLWKWSRV